MRTIIIAFTQPGLQLAKKAAQNTEGTVEIYGHERCMDTGDSVDRAGSTDSCKPQRINYSSGRIPSAEKSGNGCYDGHWRWHDANPELYVDGWLRCV